MLILFFCSFQLCSLLFPSLFLRPSLLRPFSPLATHKILSHPHNLRFSQLLKSTKSSTSTSVQAAWTPQPGQSPARARPDARPKRSAQEFLVHAGIEVSDQLHQCFFGWIDSNKVHRAALSVQLLRNFRPDVAFHFYFKPRQA